MPIAAADQSGALVAYGQPGLGPLSGTKVYHYLRSNDARLGRVSSRSTLPSSAIKWLGRCWLFSLLRERIGCSQVLHGGAYP
jgi:hypothetical protein